MTVNWNPNSTGTKGLEVFWPTTKSFALDSPTKMLGLSLDQSVSQAIGTIKVPVSSIPVRGGTYVLEVFDGETAVSSTGGSVTTLTARPNEDVSGVSASAWSGIAAGTTNIYADIDESTPSSSDYISNSSGPDTYAGRMSTGSLSLTGKRIVAVRLCAYIGGYRGYNSQAQLGLNISGTDYWGPIYSGMPHGSGTSSTYFRSVEWTTNPATGAAWTIAAVQALDTTDEWLVASMSTNTVFVSNAYLEVDVADTNDERLAYGILDDSTSGLTAGAWNSVTVTTPTGGTWTKDGSGRHLYTLRRTSSTGSLVVPLLDGDAVSFASGWQPTLDSSSLLVTSMGDERTEVFGLIQRTTAPADSVDSIPYVTQVAALVFSGTTAQQEFSSAGASTYGQLRFLVKANSATAALSVKVKRRSDNTQFGATLTVTADAANALDDEGGGWRLVDETLSSTGTLATATQYYIEFSSNAAGTGSDYWSVLAYDSWGSGDTTGFGGTTDRATLTTSTSVAAAEADRYDIPATFSVAPSPMSGGDTTLLTLSVTDGVGMAVAGIDYVRASWTATALGASFSRYDLDRSEDGGTTWTRIAKITDEATHYFDDIEGLRDVAASYRVRSVTTAGASSDWLSCGTETPTGATGALYLTSNWSMEDSLVFHASGSDPVPAWAQLDTSTIRTPYGVDGHWAFRPTERRLRTFAVTIYPPEQLSSTGRAGVGVFDALDDFLALSIPYVCVMDFRGDRWFADVTVGQEVELSPAVYTQALVITELSRSPVPPTITAVTA